MLFHLRSISKLKSILSFENLEKVVHAFVLSRLDYCNVLYLGLNQHSLSLVCSLFRTQLPEFVQIQRGESI